MVQPSPPAKPHLGRIAVILASVMIVSSLTILAAHGLWWLRHGSAPELSTLQMLGWFDVGAPHVHWADAQKALAFILHSPAAAMLFWSGLLLMIAGGRALDRYDEGRRS